MKVDEKLQGELPPVMGFRADTPRIFFKFRCKCANVKIDVFFDQLLKVARNLMPQLYRLGGPGLFATVKTGQHYLD